MEDRKRLDELRTKINYLKDEAYNKASETGNPTALENSPISLAAISALETEADYIEKEMNRNGNSFGSTSKRKTSKHKSRKRKTSKRKSRKSRKRKTSKRKSRKSRKTN
jgi:hypothetical protein